MVKRRLKFHNIWLVELDDCLFEKLKLDGGKIKKFQFNVNKLGFLYEKKINLIGRWDGVD